jgi:hypothetical protein
MRGMVGTLSTLCAAVPLESVSDPKLCLFNNQGLIFPFKSNINAFHFRLPAPPQKLLLRSRCDRPERAKTGTDGRVLGFGVWRISASDGRLNKTLLPSDLAELDGFYEPEPPGHIWTNGEARLPVSLFEGMRGTISLCVEGFGLDHYPAEIDVTMALLDAMRNVISLGENCELGFTQRFYDAEPIDLLRWASTSFDQVSAGLRSHFEGLGDARHAELVWTGEEYRLVDHRYASFHTMVFEKVDAIAQAKLFDDCLRRLAFQRRKLIYDLQEGRRIAVYRTLNPGFLSDQRFHLLESLRALGPARLLVLTPTARSSGGGIVTALGNNLFSGYFNPDTSGEASFRTIASLCQMVSHYSQ